MTSRPCVCAIPSLAFTRSMGHEGLIMTSPTWPFMVKKLTVFDRGDKIRSLVTGQDRWVGTRWALWVMSYVGCAEGAELWPATCSSAPARRCAHCRGLVIQLVRTRPGA